MRKNKPLKPVEPVVYCGPDIRHIAKSFTTYAEPPVTLTAFAEKCPTVSALIVPLSKMAETRRALKIPGTREAVLYASIVNFIRGGIK